MQMHMCCIFCVLRVRKAMKCNILGCSHATAIFHFRLNSHFHDYSSGFKVSINFVCQDHAIGITLYLVYHI